MRTPNYITRDDITKFVYEILGPSKFDIREDDLPDLEEVLYYWLRSKGLIEFDVEKEIIEILDMICDDHHIKPLSDSFYERIEALKAKVGKM